MIRRGKGEKGNEETIDRVSSYYYGGYHVKRRRCRRFDNCISETAYEACIEYGEQYGICPELLMAIIETESRGQSDVVGGGCVGLMQISPKWHKDRMERLGVKDLFYERSNILVGTDYLSELRDKYHEVSLTLDVYHGDSKAQENYEKGVISDYARKILERSAELEEGGF